MYQLVGFTTVLQRVNYFTSFVSSPLWQDVVTPHVFSRASLIYVVSPLCRELVYNWKNSSQNCRQGEPFFHPPYLQNSTILLWILFGKKNH